MASAVMTPVPHELLRNSVPTPKQLNGTALEATRDGAHVLHRVALPATISTFVCLGPE
jgi:hypothetical protein